MLANNGAAPAGGWVTVNDLEACLERDGDGLEREGAMAQAGFDTVELVGADDGADRGRQRGLLR